MYFDDSGGMVLGEHWRRLLTKAITYRLLIIVLDVTSIYLFTGRLDIALGCESSRRFAIFAANQVSSAAFLDKMKKTWSFVDAFVYEPC